MSSEAVVLQRTMLAMASLGGHAWRNNSGAFQDEKGRWIRYGLANSSASLNAAVKSSDIIGLTPVTAWLASANAWVRLGVFTALEVKPSNWTHKPSDERANAQAKFHAIVREAGGFAGFVTDEKDIPSIIRQL